MKDEKPFCVLFSVFRFLDWELWAFIKNGKKTTQKLEATDFDMKHKYLPWKIAFFWNQSKVKSSFLKDDKVFNMIREEWHASPPSLPPSLRLLLLPLPHTQTPPLGALEMIFWIQPDIVSIVQAWNAAGASSPQMKSWIACNGPGGRAANTQTWSENKKWLTASMVSTTLPPALLACKTLNNGVTSKYIERDCAHFEYLRKKSSPPRGPNKRDSGCVDAFLKCFGKRQPQELVRHWIRKATRNSLSDEGLCRHLRLAWQCRSRLNSKLTKVEKWTPTSEGLTCAAQRQKPPVMHHRGFCAMTWNKVR